MKYDIIEIEDYDGTKKIVAMPREAQKRETKTNTHKRGAK
jgi:hypothetical protein